MEATLEPRLVIPGNDGEPFISGDFLVAAYQRGYRWGRHEVRQLLDDIKANADEARKQGSDAKRLLPAARRGAVSRGGASGSSSTANSASRPCT